MPGTSQDLIEQARIGAALGTAEAMQRVHKRKHGVPNPRLASQIEKLDKEWWEYEDLLTCHGEKQL